VPHFSTDIDSSPLIPSFLHCRHYSFPLTFHTIASLEVEPFHHL
jgi:hypothetical protein